MCSFHLLTVSSRTAAFLLAPEGTRFSLARPMAWLLLDSTGNEIQAGRSDKAPLFLEGLAPDSAYVLHCDLGALAFTTMPCAGLVDATDHGVRAQAEDNTAAFAQAIAAVPEGGTLRVPAGRFVTGPVFLKARMTLWLCDGAELHAKGNRDNWPILTARDAAGRVIGTWEGLPEAMFAAAVTAIDADGLILTGKGTVDAGGDRGDWWHWPKETRDGARRPRALFLAHSRGVQLSGITVRNAPSWTVHPMRCDDLNIAALTIWNPADSPNTDGLNPESCVGVRMTGTSFSVGDDCIAIKSGKRAPGQTDHLSPTKDVEISHCRMAHGHGAVVLGSEMSGDITDVTIRACEFIGTDRGLRIKTRRGRGGTVARVHMEDVVMQDVPTPLTANAFYFCDPDGHDAWVQDRAPAPVDDTTPSIADISLTRVSADGVTLAVAALLGLPEAPIRGVTLDQVCAAYDPKAEAAVPLMADHVLPVRHARVVSDFAEVSGEIEIKDNKEPVSC